jgi:hypothetical protein
MDEVFLVLFVHKKNTLASVWLTFFSTCYNAATMPIGSSRSAPVVSAWPATVSPRTDRVWKSHFGFPPALDVVV